MYNLIFYIIMNIIIIDCAAKKTLTQFTMEDFIAN